MSPPALTKLIKSQSETAQMVKHFSKLFFESSFGRRRAGAFPVQLRLSFQTQAASDRWELEAPLEAKHQGSVLPLDQVHRAGLNFTNAMCLGKTAVLHVFKC